MKFRDEFAKFRIFIAFSGTPIDNDYGAPHALEHYVFFGSKRNPFLGYLDDFAVNHFCSEVNASTKADHT